MPRRRRRTKSRTISGQRVPIEMIDLAKREMSISISLGKKISLQEAYRRLARRLG